MDKRINVIYNMPNVTEALDKTIRDLVEYNLDNKMDSYFKKIFKKEDSKIEINVNIKKVEKQEKYESSFKFNIDWSIYMYTPRLFRDPKDLVAHAFDHLKIEMSDKKDNVIKMPNQADFKMAA